MDTDKLLTVIRIQTEIIDILCKEYKTVFRSPVEKQKMTELQETLKGLQKELE